MPRHHSFDPSIELVAPASDDTEDVHHEEGETDPTATLTAAGIAIHILKESRKRREEDQ